MKSDLRLPASLRPALPDARFRVLERRDLREAVRIAAPIAVVVAIVSGVVFATASPGRLAVGAVVIAALIVLWGLARGPLHRRPHLGAFALITAILAGRFVTLYVDSGSANLAEAYFGLIVVGSALFLPWNRRWHGAWLAVAAAIYVVTALTLPEMADNRAYGISFALTAVLISFAGNALVQARRRRTWSADVMLLDQRATLREAQTRLKAAAHEDPLTGLSNRRRLDEDIAVLDARLSRRRFGVAAVMVDLDAFKAYNDSLGHPAGDKVLSACAAAIRGASRTSDRVYRYGGEEILVLLEEDSRDVALAAAERIVLAVRALGLTHPGGATGKMTISAGSAASQGRSIRPWAVIDEADRALYEAKSAGGNRAVAYHGEAAAAAGTDAEVGAASRTVPGRAPMKSTPALTGSARGAGGR